MALVKKPKVYVTVKAERQGFYLNKRRRVGQVFKVEPHEFSKNWMTLMAGVLPEEVKVKLGIVDEVKEPEVEDVPVDEHAALAEAEAEEEASREVESKDVI
jgi:hypothetical protein